MSKLFISHSSRDDAFVRELRAALADQDQPGWIDSRELRGGDPLWSEIEQAIDGASAYAVLISNDALQSKWVGKELRRALEVQKQRGKDDGGKHRFPVIPLSLDGTQLGVLEMFFDEEPIYIPVSSDAGDAAGIAAVMDVILVALGRRLPADVAATPQPRAEPLEELVLELSDLKFQESDGVRRASARARLVYEPATVGQREVGCAQSWRLVAPTGPIEAEELRWYLEKYAVWPSHYFQERARRVEEQLAEWGQRLHQAAIPVAHSAQVMQAWAKIGDRCGRRFSVLVDSTPEAGAPDAEVASAREAATLLLGLPWELLHDGHAYLFQGARPTRVRRRLPNTRDHGVAVVATPIRILLVSARPEDDACGYLDHRASALPLVEAMEALPGWSSSGCSARRRCRRYAPSWSARMARKSPTTSCTSMATASTTAASASVACASSGPRTAASSTSAGTAPCSPTSWVRCCATTAFRSSSSKPARARRPGRRPSRWPPSCSRSASRRWWR